MPAAVRRSRPCTPATGRTNGSAGHDRKRAGGAFFEAREEVAHLGVYGDGLRILDDLGQSTVEIEKQRRILRMQPRMVE